MKIIDLTKQWGYWYNKLSKFRHSEPSSITCIYTLKCYTVKDWNQKEKEFNQVVKSIVRKL